jgi:hypothetical protein
VTAKLKGFEKRVVKLRRANLRSRLEPSGDGSFIFALTLITGYVSFILYICNYAENNQIPVSSTFYFILSGFIFLSATSFIYIILYIILKAISLEIKDPDKKKQLQDTASDYYVDAFRFVIYFIAAIIICEIWNFPFYFGVLILFCSSSYIIAFKYKEFKLAKKISMKLVKSSEQKYEPWRKSLEFIFKLIVSIIILIFFIILWFILLHLKITSFPMLVLCFFMVYFYISQHKSFKPLDLFSFKFKGIGFLMPLGIIVTLLILPSIFSGHLTAEMNSIYDKQEKQIPVDILVTGLYHKEGIFVELYHHMDSQKTWESKGSIEIQANPDTNEKSLVKYPNTVLCGNDLGNGKYKVFINCSNLTEGNYELLVTTGNKTRMLSSKQSNVDGDINENILSVEQYFNGYKSVTNSFYLIESNRTYT